MDEPIYVVEDVVKVYPMGESGVVALRGVSLEVYCGEFLVVMGPSGSGKTTLLNLLSGLDMPSSGRILLEGRSLSAMREDELEELRLRRIGVVFQFLNLVHRLTARENIELPMSVLGIPERERRERVETLADRLGIRDKLDKLVEELSGGEQQRVAIAAALANDPDIILADEPTAELDGENIRRVVSLLREEVSRGKTVVVNTHDPRVAREADRVVLLEDGRVVGTYRPAEVTSMADMEKSVSDYIRRRLEEIRMEMERLVEEFRAGSLSAEEFIRRYNRLRILEEAFNEEFRVRG